MYILGIITGLLIAILNAILYARSYSFVERKVKQMGNILKTKGRVINPEDDKLSEWIDELPHEENTIGE